MYRRVITAAAATALVAISVTACSSGGSPDEGGPVTLNFESLAWQTTSIEANKAIIAAWNKDNPDVQVKYVQGDWGSIGDELTTAFEGGKAPDLFHFYDTGLQPFAERGDLLDLDEYLSDEFKSDIRPEAWANVSFADQEGVWGVPFLQEPILVYANKTQLDAAGIVVPSIDDPWTWDEYQDAAKKLTTDADGDGTPETYGAAMPLLNTTDFVVGLGQSFGATYFNADGTALEWGDAESEVPSRLHSMLYDDESMAPEVLGLEYEDVVPGFIGGKFATVFGGTYLRQQFEEGKSEEFQWVAIPALLGTSQSMPNGAQTVSVASQTDHPEEAVAFLEFLLNSEHQAQLAAGDWETPTSIGAGEQPALQDSSVGWDVAIDASENLEQSAYQQVKGWDEWLDRAGHAAFASYFADEITLDELKTTLAEEGDPVLERAARGR